MGRNKEANEAARNETRRKLLAAALELFAEKGFAGASMSALAKRAGISKGLTYHYFPNKDALVEAVVQNRILQVAALWASVYMDGQPAESLKAFAHACVKEVEEDPTAYRLYLRALTDPQVQAAAMGPAGQVDRTPFVDLFARLGHDTPEIEARFFQVSLLGILTHVCTSPMPTPGAVLVDRLIQTTLEAS